MYELIYTKTFKNSIKRYKKDKIILSEITDFLSLLQFESPISAKYNLHYLKGRFTGFLECHIKPDLLIIFNKIEKEKVILLYDIGSHSNLFG
jgi:mRNA interferase YafQ